MKHNDTKISKCFSGGASELVFWAFRYFLGRRTIATCCFADSLAEVWPLLNDRDKNLIYKELEEAFAKDDAERNKEKRVPGAWGFPLGDDCDRESWEHVRRAYTPYHKNGGTNA